MCAQKEGVIGIVGLGHFLRDNDISGENFFTNINYVAELVGPEYVAIGLDFVYYPEQFYGKVLNNPERWPKEYIQNPDGFTYFPPEQLPRVTEILIEKGYSDENIRGILGENYMRVVRQVWK
jgi:membrane dipeptidase